MRDKIMTAMMIVTLACMLFTLFNLHVAHRSLDRIEARTTMEGR